MWSVPDVNHVSGTDHLNLGGAVQRLSQRSMRARACICTGKEL